MAEYFKTDSRKITLREYWNIGRSWKALLAWSAARLGAPLQSGTGFRQPESVSELEIPESEFSPKAKEKLQLLLGQCQELGFHSPRFYLHETLRRDIRTEFISILHRSGEFTVRLMYTRAGNVNVPVEKVLAVLLSELNNGTFFFTSDQRAKIRVPTGILNNRVIGGSPLQLIQSHQEKLAQLKMRNPPRPVLSMETLDDLWDRYEKLHFEFQVRRGLYVRMTSEEIEHQQKLVETAQTMTAGGVPHADVLVELSQLQNKKAGWGNAIWIFVLSLILFVGFGSRQWSWKYVMILVPVLFIHELGHYIAMRAFNYRNLRMFFIPFFGAAVAGQHYNVPGWKKVIVSMMGPVPGIVLGAIIGGAGLVLHQPWLIRVALVALILNGINLLPVLPLDGGWIFHTMIFSRHHMLDAGFRVVAAIALICGGMYSNEKILMYLAIPMLIGIPAAYRMARISTMLRERGVPPSSQDDQTVPTETAVAIIDELKKIPSPRVTNKMMAQQTLQIFETLNARPPGWLATSGLLFAYLTSLGMAVVFAGVVTVGQRGDSSGLLANSVNRPKRSLMCGAFWSWRGEEAVAGHEMAPIMIVANFSNRSKAEKGFQGLTNRLPPSATATIFGDSLFLTFPGGETGLRKQWFAELQNQTKMVLADSSNNPAMFSISCRLPTEKQAKEMEDELMEYFSGNLGLSLIPPWHPDDRRSPDQRAAHQLARKSYLKAQASQWSEYQDPKIRALQKQINEARRQGDEVEAAALRKQVESLSADLARARLENLKAGKEGPMDSTIIDLYASSIRSIAATNFEAERKIMRDIAQRMGRLPDANGVVDPREDRFSTRSAFVLSTGKTLQVNWASFTRISDGAPALIDWLCAKGGAEFRYDIVSGASPIADGEQ